MAKSVYHELLAELENSLELVDDVARVVSEPALKAKIYRLAEISALESGQRQSMARYLTRLAAQALGIQLASIHELYLARGRGEVPFTFTVPAINLRTLSFDGARAVFRVANQLDAGAFIFEIARSEMGYTDQRPAEYVTNVLAAAIHEGFRGPVFVQGDHFQVSAKRYTADPETELQALRELTVEAVKAGFFNIDIDASTLVDLSKETLAEQQALNTSLSAMFTALIREIEPAGVTISVGGEIGEVGGQNSTEAELVAYMEGYQTALAKSAPGKPGISKISVQTGTSHGGVVLPDGSIASVSVDFDTLLRLSRVARHEYGMGGAVQHGASTLPEDAFGKFVESEACEVHLATNFQNIFFNHIPDDLKAEMYAYLDVKNAGDRKPELTAEQFYYKTRKNAIGPFKAKSWGLPADYRDAIGSEWEKQFLKLFNLLGLVGTRKYVTQTILAVAVPPDVRDYLGEAVLEEDVSDLAD